MRMKRKEGGEKCVSVVVRREYKGTGGGGGGSRMRTGDPGRLRGCPIR